MGRKKLSITVFALTFALLGSYIVLHSFADTVCTVTATPSDVNSKVAASQANDVVCLSSGTYSGLSVSNSTSRTGYAVVQSAPGAMVNVGDLNLNNVSYIHLQNITFTGGTVKGHHIHITDSTGAQHILNGVSQILKIYGTINNADILVDHITYNDIPNPCTNNACVEGRISVMDGGNPSGITISNSYFSGGNSDGIQILGSPVGVQIIGNEFTNITASNGTHTDSIQTYYSGSGTVIKNNYFHDSDDGLMMPDGGTNEQIVGNVFDLKGYPYDIVIYDWTGGLIQHNTFKHGTSCSWDACGTLWVRETTGLVVKDNIIGELKVDSGTISEDYNLINVNGTKHDHTITGLPTYSVGTPAAWANFSLTAASKGHNAASDGTDMGANYFGATSSGGGGTTKTGDFNSDGVVNIYDLGIFLNKWQSTTAPEQDLNSDGIVNIYDLGVFLSHYGT